MDVTTVRVRIEGRVQGVWYRAWTVEQARHLRLSGWVRNRRDGSVEALFSGPPDAVEAMIAACHRGPSAASVRSVERFPAGAEERPGDGFAQLPTE